MLRHTKRSDPSAHMGGRELLRAIVLIGTGLMACRWTPLAGGDARDEYGSCPTEGEELSVAAHAGNYDGRSRGTNPQPGADEPVIGADP